MSATLSIIVPALNEAAGIATVIAGLKPLRDRGAQVVLVDGGSTDATVALARLGVDRVVTSAPGRAVQMNAGAAVATGSVLLFLHADTRLPRLADHCIRAALASGACWGRFDVHIDGRSYGLGLVAALMNMRSRWTGIATGDQAIFVDRTAFERIGGFTPMPLMEDIDLSRRLLALARPACLTDRVVTSGRRWDERGLWRTVWLMWRLRWRYWRGESPAALAKAYR
jgi:rSAM/selenodomain-associated transferase 2